MSQHPALSADHMVTPFLEKQIDHSFKERCSHGAVLWVEQMGCVHSQGAVSRGAHLLSPFV